MSKSAKGRIGDLMNGTGILENLVSFDGVVGTPNAAIVKWIVAYLASHGAGAKVPRVGRAQKPDEFILESKLAACQRFIEAVGARCAA